MKPIRLALGALLALSVLPSPAHAQDKYPSKPIKILIPFGPGGAPDIVARVVGEQLRASLGQAIVIENKPGAFGILAVETMAAAKPDGYTLMMGNVATNAMTPIIHRKRMKIDYEKAVVPVMRLTRIPAFLVIAPSIPAKTSAEFVAWAKQRSGQVRYNTAGAGSFVHVDLIAFSRKAGIEAAHIPVKSGAVQMMSDIMRGDAHFTFMNVATSAGQVRGGGVRALAIAADKRLPEFPDLPTMAEIGYAGIGTAQWQGLFAPASTPDAVIERLHKAVTEALKTETVRAHFAKSFVQIDPTGSPAEARTWLKDEMTLWAKAWSEANINLDD
ncbi:MAG: ABC transporter substrate-binding protein [Rhizobiales bacterium]|nr:ABC transporter substrate-binding protein [Hyphomicrobiales bacterium]